MEICFFQTTDCTKMVINDSNNNIDEPSKRELISSSNTEQYVNSKSRNQSCNPDLNVEISSIVRDGLVQVVYVIA